MQAAKDVGTVKRVVLTSSFASVIDVDRGAGPGFTYTGKDWNPLTYEEACKGDAVIAYRGSKKFAELAAWDFVKENANSINFDLVTHCPPMTFGEVCHPIKGHKDLNVSNAVLWSIVEGVDPLPVSRVPVWINVGDLAKAHVNSLLIPEVGGRRYVPASPEKFSYQKIADIIREKFPWAKSRVTKGNPNEPIPESYDLDSQAVTDDLGVTFTSLEETIYKAIYQFALWEGSGISKEELAEMIEDANKR
ncbi:methylglyoxal reductase (NADPH-dependent) GRE2 [Sugiyamaella lignohabitans]|uniref:Methylglyoxal reductase (NADPH-dependent) GRE2 n=1 Tax=Sugiyamaella lignohabitans TaxID=796027 RepID=A0A167FSR1_9ASCO|nr:methylglyoxal reductase (NADPH-dependent) GRE2 [Sugiyamaella lignohabitans]ANB15656.1 methylglyoxal reductase (NADPH-dependent) GRE2 [Sugiyamaella lignohabitans]